jgi:glycosyltransferase involved in cell wall biosynthesis
MEFGLLNPLARWLMPKMIHKLRLWDYSAAQRPDFFLANSRNTQSRISKYYDRESTVLYPCLDIQNIPFSSQKEDYYFYAGRVIPYKKFNLLVETFNIN